MAKPTNKPEWAESDYVDPVIGTNNVVEPPALKKDKGWEYQEFPPYNWMNWLFRTIKSWIDYISDEALEGTFTFTGNKTFSNKVEIDGITQLDGAVDINNNTTLDGTFDVTGATSITGDLDLNGDLDCYAISDANNLYSNIFQGSISSGDSFNFADMDIKFPISGYLRFQCLSGTGLNVDFFLQIYQNGDYRTIETVNRTSTGDSFVYGVQLNPGKYRFRIYVNAVSSPTSAHTVALFNGGIYGSTDIDAAI